MPRLRISIPYNKLTPQDLSVHAAAAFQPCPARVNGETWSLEKSGSVASAPYPDWRRHANKLYVNIYFVSIFLSLQDFYMADISVRSDAHKLLAIFLAITSFQPIVKILRHT
jgi:hypothetical protein